MIPLNFPAAPGSLVSSDLSLVLAKSEHSLEFTVPIDDIRRSPCYRVSYHNYSSFGGAKRHQAYRRPSLSLPASLIETEGCETREAEKLTFLFGCAFRKLVIRFL